MSISFCTAIRANQTNTSNDVLERRFGRSMNGGRVIRVEKGTKPDLKCLCFGFCSLKLCLQGGVIWHTASRSGKAWASEEAFPMDSLATQLRHQCKQEFGSVEWLNKHARIPGLDELHRVNPWVWKQKEVESRSEQLHVLYDDKHVQSHRLDTLLWRMAVDLLVIPIRRNQTF